MLEYQDKKFGKVKLVTVTEARANFATLLQDKDTHYIITKNNKPIRVIVNYQAFEDLHKRASNPPVEKKTFEHLSGLLEERSEELKSRPEVKKENLPPSDELLDHGIEIDKSAAPGEINLPPKLPSKVPPKAQDVFIEDDIEGNILDVFQSGMEVSQQNDEKEENTISEVSESMSDEETSQNYFESGDDDEAFILHHPEHVEEIAAPPKETPVVIKVETIFPPEEEMTPEQRDYFQKYRKLYENPIPVPEITMSVEAQDVKKPLPYDDVTREVEKRLAAKWGKNESQYAETPVQNLKQAEDDFLEEPISEDPQDPNGLPSLKDLLKDLEHETLSGDEIDKEGLEKGDIDALIHRITHDY